MKLYDIPTANEPRKPVNLTTESDVIGANRFRRKFVGRLDARLQLIELHAYALMYGDAPHLHLAAVQEEAQHIMQTAPVGGWGALGLLANDIDTEIEKIWGQLVTSERALRILPQLERLLTEGAVALGRA